MSQHFPLAGKRIWVAGHRGMVGSALVRRLAGEDCELLSEPRSELDLARQADVEDWVAGNRPDAIILTAARVGGIQANLAAPWDFIHDNLAIQANVIGAALACGVGRLLTVASAAIYPLEAEQPIVEAALLSSAPEAAHRPYAIAKIAGIELCRAARAQHGADYVAAVPINLYGPGDNFDPETSHVVPGMIRRIWEAKQSGAAFVTLWGTGTPMRELLHADDLADALVFLLRHYSGEAPVNVGSGEEVSIRALAGTIAASLGFEGEIRFDPARPDGAARRRIDSSVLNALGWNRARPLADGIAETCRAFVAQTSGS